MADKIHKFELKTTIHIGEPLDGLVEIESDELRYSSTVLTDINKTMGGVQHNFSDDISDELRKELDKMAIALTNIKKLIYERKEN